MHQVSDIQTISTIAAALSRPVVLAFDWNGTIVNDIERSMVATNLVLAGYRIPPLNLEGFRSTFKLPMHEYFRGLSVPDSTIGQAVADWNVAIASDTTELHEGVTEVLAAARQADIPTGVISAASEGAVAADATALGIAPLLSFVIGGALSKRDALRELAGRYRARVIYCGDTEYDLAEANAAGAIPIGFGAGYRPSAALWREAPLTVIDNFFDFATAVERSQQRRLHGPDAQPKPD